MTALVSLVVKHDPFKVDAMQKGFIRLLQTCLTSFFKLSRPSKSKSISYSWTRQDTKQAPIEISDSKMAPGSRCRSPITTRHAPCRRSAVCLARSRMAARDAASFELSPTVGNRMAREARLFGNTRDQAAQTSVLAGRVFRRVDGRLPDKHPSKCQTLWGDY
jgi:hypothetical protein